VITMSGAGHDIWDNADDFRFAHRPFSGNGSITVKVESIVNTNNWAKAGVMIRESLDADSKFAYMVVSAAQGVSFGWRPVTAGTCSSVSQAGVAAPQWVKLTRTGDVLTAQYSADGQIWTDVKNADGTVASTTISMAGSIYIGLCVTSHNSAATTTAEFSNAAVSSGPAGSWQVTAIGDDPQWANSPGDLYVTVQDSANQTATVVHPTLVTTDEWTEWKIPLRDFAGVNMTRVKTLYVGVGDRANPTPGGAGRIFIDDIGFGRPAVP
jgi:regulation of enolase protein 1 (concanavalin A-like superfamily)